jgi:hypothetical protein
MDHFRASRVRGPRFGTCWGLPELGEHALDQDGIAPLNCQTEQRRARVAGGQAGKHASSLPELMLQSGLIVVRRVVPKAIRELILARAGTNPRVIFASFPGRTGANCWRNRQSRHDGHLSPHQRI